MNNLISTASTGRKFTGCLAGLFLFVIASGIRAGDRPPGAAEEYQPAPDEFSALGQAVVDLLRRGATARFATSLAASAEDWKSVLDTNSPAAGEDSLKDYQKRSAYERQRVESSARSVLARATALHLDFTTNEWHARIILPRQFGSAQYPGLRGGKDGLPWADGVEIVLESDAGAGGAAKGEFKLAARGMVRFPAGWRSSEGIQWETFPDNVGDEKTRLELAILTRLEASKGLNSHDDPALTKLGESLIRFVRERDPAIFERDVFMTADLLWSQMAKSGRNGPTRKELDEQFGPNAKAQTDLARAALQQMEESGIDLKDADIQIKECGVERAQARGAMGSIDGLVGNQFELKLAVKSAGKAKSGTSLTGEYILAANTLMRFENEWRVMNNLHWQQLPDGILDPAVVEQMNFENYVAQNGTLPPKTAAPEIEFVTLDGEKKMKLSDLRGKVVVLDFWATWCGPCQEPMAELQKIRAAHPDWKDRVAIVPLSIDDTLDAVRQHVDKRGWTNTFNVWADEGGWQAKPPKAFRVTGVPTTYIIDAKGKIVRAGHPAVLPIGEIVDGLVKE